MSSSRYIRGSDLNPSDLLRGRLDGTIRPWRTDSDGTMWYVQGEAGETVEPITSDDVDDHDQDFDDEPETDVDDEPVDAGYRRPVRQDLKAPIKAVPPTPWRSILGAVLAWFAR